MFYKTSLEDQAQDLETQEVLYAVLHYVDILNEPIELDEELDNLVFKCKFNDRLDAYKNKAKSLLFQLNNLEIISFDKEDCLAETNFYMKKLDIFKQSFKLFQDIYDEFSNELSINNPRLDLASLAWQARELLNSLNNEEGLVINQEKINDLYQQSLVLIEYLEDLSMGNLYQDLNTDEENYNLALSAFEKLEDNVICARVLQNIEE